MIEKLIAENRKLQGESAAQKSQICKLRGEITKCENRVKNQETDNKLLVQENEKLTGKVQYLLSYQVLNENQKRLFCYSLDT